MDSATCVIDLPRQCEPFRMPRGVGTFAPLREMTSTEIERKKTKINNYSVNLNVDLGLTSG